MYLIYTVPVDVLAPQDARPSTTTENPTRYCFVRVSNSTSVQINTAFPASCIWIDRHCVCWCCGPMGGGGGGGWAFQGHRADHLTEKAFFRALSRFHIIHIWSDKHWSSSFLHMNWSSGHPQARCWSSSWILFWQGLSSHKWLNNPVFDVSCLWIHTSSHQYCKSLFHAYMN